MANGTLKVENIQTSSGSGTITLGQSGETITIPTGTTVSGAMSNTPAFQASLSTQTDLADATATDVLFDNVALDTHNFYDSSTGRFTPTVPGWYKFSTNILFSCSVSFDLRRVIVYMGSVVHDVNPDQEVTRFSVTLSNIVYMDGSTNYMNIRAYQQVIAGATPRLEANDCTFCGHKIIGA